MLFGKLAANPNAYYHGRGSDQKSEYGLTTRALVSMQEYLEQSDPFRLKTLPPNTKMKNVDRGNMKTPVAVIFAKSVAVTIETRVPGAKIRYTLDGTEPDKNSPLYEGSILIERTTKLTAKAYKPGIGFSPVFTTTYVIE